jgi:tRNA pseudouridine55 synthase
VRAIARDLGRRLGCYGHVIALRRTRVGPFDEDTAVALDELLAASEDPARSGDVMRALLPVETALEDLIGINVTSSDAARLARGQSIILRGRDAPIVAGNAYAMCKGQLVAIGDMDKGELRPTRVFNHGG